MAAPVYLYDYIALSPKSLVIVVSMQAALLFTRSVHSRPHPTCLQSSMMFRESESHCATRALPLRLLDLATHRRARLLVSSNN
jgi:hypothetical protein